MVKHTLTLLLCMAWALMSTAQNTIESIRKEYQDLKEWTAMMSENFPSEGIPAEYIDMRVLQNLPGTGPHLESIRMYYGYVELPEEEDYNPYTPHYLHFVSSKYNYAATEFYEEYLYDNKGQIQFIFAITPNMGSDMTSVYELRMWFDGEKLLRFTAKKAAVNDALDLKTIKKATFREEYSGNTIPDIYRSETERCQQRAQRFLTMFKGIDDNTYQYQ